MKSRDAEKLLKLLWDAKIKHLKSKEDDDKGLLLPEEESALSQAISMLHCLITDVIPSFSADHAALQVMSDEAEIQHVEFLCTTTRDPGLHFESFSNAAMSSSTVIYISYIEKGTVADRVEIFKRGDIVLEVNGHSLARVSVERAR